MSETQAASSPAEVDVFQGEQPTFDEYTRYRQTGEVPARFKPAAPADSAPADTPEKPAKPEGDKPESASDSESDKNQEQPPKGSGAEKRILQLLAKNKELERKLQESAPKTDAQTVSSPVEPPQAAQQFTRPKPTLQDKNQDGSDKFKAYEEYVEDLTEWKAEQSVARYRQEQMQHAELGALKVKLDEARARYEDADSVIFPAAQAIKDAQIPQAVKQVFNDSDVFVDLCYVVGSDPDELKSFVRLAQTNPRAALAKVFEYERGIKEELAKAGTTSAPEKKQTAAPKPPVPVSGGSSRAFDVSDESLSAEEWARKRNADLRKRGKG